MCLLAGKTTQAEAVLHQLWQSSQPMTVREIWQALLDQGRFCILPDAPKQGFTFVSQAGDDITHIRRITRALSDLAKRGDVCVIDASPKLFQAAS